MNILSRYILLPISLVYGIVVWLRNILFEARIFRTTELPIPVVSVGNISTGGTGKTPMVEYIARTLHENGKRTAVLSRGYRRESTGFLLVSDGSAIYADYRIAGDEPVQLAARLPGIIVAVDGNRSRGGKMLVQSYAVEVIVLDDGFQHRWLSRDLDIVLMDASRLGENRFLLPSGTRREPFSSLRRADIGVITKYRSDSYFEVMERLLRKNRCGLSLGAHIKPLDYLRLTDGTVLSLDFLIAHRAFLFSGIAYPDDFYRSVIQTDVQVVGRKWFRDHHRFVRSELEEIVTHAKKNDAECLITTEKDSVRLSEYIDIFKKTIPVYVLRICLNFTDEGKKVVDDHLHILIQKYNNMQTIQ
jgi:tetraacyldisaccharide 4'-kinase